MKKWLIAAALLALPAQADDAEIARNLECAGALGFAISQDDEGETVETGLSGDDLGLGMYTYGEKLQNGWRAAGKSEADGAAAFQETKTEMGELYATDASAFKDLVNECFDDIS